MRETHFRVTFRSAGAAPKEPSLLLSRTRRWELIQHEIVVVEPRVFGIARGYEDLNDRDQLRHDPMIAGSGRQACSGAIWSRRFGQPPSLGRDILPSSTLFTVSWTSLSRHAGPSSR